MNLIEETRDRPGPVGDDLETLMDRQERLALTLAEVTR